MTWDELLKEGDETVKIVRAGLTKRGFLTGDSLKTIYGTDEDIPIFNGQGEKLFWVSVKTVYGNIDDPKKINFQGWMCGEIDSKQWCNPPAFIIWFCRESGVAWGTITPKRLSQKWLVFPNQYGKIIDQRKTRVLKKNIYLYPSYCVPTSEILTKDEIIEQIKLLVEQKS